MASTGSAHKPTATSQMLGYHFIFTPHTRPHPPRAPPAYHEACRGAIHSTTLWLSCSLRVQPAEAAWSRGAGAWRLHDRVREPTGFLDLLDRFLHPRASHARFSLAPQVIPSPFKHSERIGTTKGDDAVERSFPDLIVCVPKCDRQGRQRRRISKLPQ